MILQQYKLVLRHNFPYFDISAYHYQFTIHAYKTKDNKNAHVNLIPNQLC